MRSICSIIDCTTFARIKGMCSKHYKHSHYIKNQIKYLDLSKKWRQNNPEKRKQIALKWARQNKHKLNRYYLNNKEKWKKSRINRKDKINLYFRNKKQKEPLFRLICNLRKRTCDMIKAKKTIKNNTTLDLLGCDLNKLKQHLESKFTNDMNWNNYGKWHVDHIIPLSSATTQEETYKLCHYTNLQPLWAIDNLKKSNKITQ